MEKGQILRALAAAAALVLILVGTLSVFAEGQEETAMIGSSESGGLWGGRTGEDEILSWNPEWMFADYSQIHESDVTLYRSDDPLGIVVAVNAGHGTAGGENFKTLCHPDGSPKVTGGSTAEGAVYAISVSSGTTMLDGSAEAEHTLSLALILKDKLLERGFDVLMIRESADVQLDNIARTVFANQYADCHLSLHYDGSESDKGFFYIGVPDVASYRSMQPVASFWQQDEQLGQCLVSGYRSVGGKIYGEGRVALDLTQTSYSTIPSLDVEVGDAASDCSYDTQSLIAEGIVKGVELYFGH